MVWLWWRCTGCWNVQGAALGSIFKEEMEEIILEIDRSVSETINFHKAQLKNEFKSNFFLLNWCPGSGLIMAFKLSVLLLLLAVATVTVQAQRRRQSSASRTATATGTTEDEWNFRDGCEHWNYSLFTLGQRSSSASWWCQTRGERSQGKLPVFMLS